MFSNRPSSGPPVSIATRRDASPPAEGTEPPIDPEETAPISAKADAILKMVDQFVYDDPPR